MSQPDEMVDAWVEGVASSEPELAPHLDEIADHLLSAARERMAAGTPAPEAFAAAVAAFGAPRDLASQYVVSSHRTEMRHATRFAAITVVTTLVLTATVVAIDKLFYPIQPIWTVVLYLPVLLAAALYWDFRRQERGVR